ncbi:MAG: TAT-variant-translocated molybdopterin oxidoreductase [Acidobacteriota bacterium]
MSILKIVKDDAPQRAADVPAEGGSSGLSLEEIRERLAGAEGRQFWRSVDQLAGSEGFRELLHREFPRQASEWLGGGTSRRRFLQLMSASLALGGLSGCVKQPAEKILPYVRQPVEVKPGTPLYFASAATVGGYATGILVESHTGRPTKIEGNPDHPASLGGTDTLVQGMILDLYDPDRAQEVTDTGRPRTWGALVEALQPHIDALRAVGGAGIRILTEAVSSPTLASQLEDLRSELPEMRWHTWEPAAGHPAAETARSTFGRPLEVRYDLTKVDVLITLDSDFLTQGPGSARYAADFSARRRVWEAAEADRSMARYYALESTVTATGTLADHRLPLPPSTLAKAAKALASRLGADASSQVMTGFAPAVEEWLTAAVSDLSAAGSGALVVAGPYASPEVQAAAQEINAALGSEAVTYSESIDANPVDQGANLGELVSALESGSVELLVIVGGNPVFNAPADSRLPEAILEAKEALYLGLYENETSRSCRWQVPAKHFLEGWSDARAFDGTASIVQPLIDPLYRSCRSAHQVVALLAGRSEADEYELVRDYWAGQGLDDRALRSAIHNGVVPDTERPAVVPSAAGGSPLAPPLEPAADGEIELVFRPDPTIWDGRFVNNGWLQECPKPLTKLTWDNALLLAPATAAAYGLANGDRVHVAVGERTVEGIPVWIQPGLPAKSATLHFGYGGSGLGRVGKGTGFDVYPLRTAAGLWNATATLTKADGQYPLANTQDHGSMEGRHLVRSASLEEYSHHPDFAQHMVHVPTREQSMYPPHEHDGYAWGMVVDLNACMGCNACVVACQAENNIPVVGKDQVLKAREMHWLRVDRYYEGDLDNPRILHQPVSCQHCEQAPCEVVCPVAATVHSPEGLNEMVYNRCVGTRYCSNNCPYKVRRFNFLQYVDNSTETLKMVRNPYVTVRDRGVMEKCTYCVQRINRTRIAATVEGRKVRDNEIKTACQGACPSDCIRFGDISDPTTGVSEWKDLPLNYGLLEELNTRPRTTYLARVSNPSRKLETT